MHLTGGSISKRKSKCKGPKVGVQWQWSKKESSVFREQADIPKGKRKDARGKGRGKRV